MEISEIIQILEDYVHSQKEETQFNDAVEQAAGILMNMDVCMEIQPTAHPKFRMRVTSQTPFLPVEYEEKVVNMLDREDIKEQISSAIENIIKQNL